MLPRADSAEFAHLLDRWLDHSATDEEAELFWRCVSESPSCAAEFAAAARFEGLLADTVKARDVEAEARKVLAVSAASPSLGTPAYNPPTARRSVTGSHAARPAPPAPVPMRAFAIAAALVVLGLVSAMLWPTPTQDSPKVTKASSPTPPIKPALTPTVPTSTPSTIPEPGAISKVDMAPVETQPGAAPQFTEIPLTTRLDQFWLNGVALNQVPLSQAMAILRQLLVETDDKGSLPLDQLSISVPAGATNRRVSFYSDSIPYLKAVRAVAALAGCEVLVDDLSITLQLQPGIFPQVAEKHTLTDMLATRVLADGSSALQKQARIDALWKDAAALGISIAEDGTASASQGQWAALAVMTDARDQRDAIQLSALAVYLIQDGQLPRSGVLTAEDTRQLQQSLLASGVQPLAVVMPNLDPPENQRPLITASTKGESVTYSAANAPTVQQTVPQSTPDQPQLQVANAMVLTGQTLAYNPGSNALRLMNPGSVSFGNSTSFAGNSTQLQGTLVFIPVQVQVPAPSGSTSPASGGSPP